MMKKNVLLLLFVLLCVSVVYAEDRDASLNASSARTLRTLGITGFEPSIIERDTSIILKIQWEQLSGRGRLRELRNFSNIVSLPKYRYAEDGTRTLIQRTDEEFNALAAQTIQRVIVPNIIQRTQPRVVQTTRTTNIGRYNVPRGLP